MVSVLVCKWCTDEPFVVSERFGRYMLLHFERAHRFEPEHLRAFKRHLKARDRHWIWGRGKSAVMVVERMSVTMP